MIIRCDNRVRLKNLKVLLIDDDPDLLHQGKIFLEQKRDCLEVETANSGEDGLEKIEEKSYDAVVSDHQMPDMTGVELLKETRDRGYEIPIILFTGRGREEVAMEALNNGANRYLRKGGDPKSQYGVLAQAIIQEVKYHRMENIITSGAGIVTNTSNYADSFEKAGYEGPDNNPSQRRVTHGNTVGIGKNVN